MTESQTSMNKKKRVYANENNGDAKDQKLLLTIDVCLLGTHCALELMYIFFRCTPMMLINILSILSYVAGVFIIKKGRILEGSWLMLWEVYLHVLCVAYFFGGTCGFQQWLYGVLCAAFFPYIEPMIQNHRKRISRIYGTLLIVSYLLITISIWKNPIPAQYKPSENAQVILFCINSMVGFFSIILYNRLYSGRMIAKNDELKRMADYDSLTGLYNRLRIQKFLNNEVKHQEGKTCPLSIAIMDIDFFKKVNDTYGHNAGDFVLRELAKILMPSRDQGLIIGRWGGEEFILIAPEDYPYPAFCVALKGIGRMIEQHEFNYNGTVIPVTVSIGASEFKEDLTIEKLIQAADARLYEAKESGRNRVIC